MQFRSLGEGLLPLADELGTLDWKNIKHQFKYFMEAMRESCAIITPPGVPAIAGLE
ncbi:MAG: hypothetical protein PHP25_00955 [Candidatus Moranbacteria bacterium]|nr:hypothetical protein [Candidatus Moranbacteria bacterium]